MGVMASSGISPAIAAFLIELYGWSWVFFMNVPTGVLALVGAWAFIPEVAKEPKRRLDWFGFAFLIVFIIALSLMVGRGERLGWLESTEIILEGAVVLFALYVFIVHSATTHRPFLEPRLFVDRNYVMNLFIIFLFGALTFVPLFLIPLQLQNLGGYPLVLIGILLVARGAGVLCGMAVIGPLIHRIDPRLWLVAGFLTQVVAGWPMSGWAPDIRAWHVVWTVLLQGFGTGIMFVPISVMAFSTLPTRYRTEGLAIFHLMLNLGTAIGIAALFNVFAQSLQINHEVLSGTVTSFNELFRYGAVPEGWDPTELSGLLAIDAEVTRQAAMIAYNNTYYLIAIVALGAIPLVYLLRPPRRRMHRS